MSLTFRGQDKMAAKLARLAREFPDRVGRALYQEAEAIMTISKRDHVPVDLGALKTSGHVERPKRHGQDISVSMVYGGPAAPYALAVHEHPSRHSPPSWRMARGGDGRFRAVRFHPEGHGPKYLEKPLRARAAGMKGRLIARILGG